MNSTISPIDKVIIPFDCVTTYNVFNLFWQRICMQKILKRSILWQIPVWYTQRNNLSTAGNNNQKQQLSLGTCYILEILHNFF